MLDSTVQSHNCWLLAKQGLFALLSGLSGLGGCDLHQSDWTALRHSLLLVAQIDWSFRIPAAEQT